MLLDDSFAQKLSVKAAPAFWRAFIVQNRKTGIISAKMRWNYIGKGRSWIEVEPSSQGNPEQMLEHLRCSLEDIIKTALIVFGVDQHDAENAIHCFYPPDDGGDPAKTIIWLEQHDLIEVRAEKIEPESEKPDGNVHE